jgi:hypothetical protein
VGVFDGRPNRPQRFGNVVVFSVGLLADETGGHWRLNVLRCWWGADAEAHPQRWTLLKRSTKGHVFASLIFEWNDFFFNFI